MNEKKPTLQEVFENYKLMTPLECFENLGWEYVRRQDDSGWDDIRCCDEPVESFGFFGTESLRCTKCGKGMQLMTAPIPTSNCTSGMISYEKVEMPTDGRLWTPHNFWGVDIGKDK